MKVRDTILVIERSPADRALLRKVFDRNYNILEAANSEQGSILLAQNHSCIAAVLLDISAPEGFALLTEIGRAEQYAKIPKLAVIDRGKDTLEARAFDLGADDVLLKPFHPVVVLRRVKTVVDLYHQRWNLELLVEEQTDILRRSNQSMVDSLCAIIETRSAESGLHILRIRQFTRLLLEEVSRSCPEYHLDEDTISIITSASALHDIGKIGIPDAILNKPDRLDPDEFEIMKRHSLIGCQMLEELRAVGNDEYLRYAHNICHYHHERWDGSGYPEGLAADDIPICAQVVGLADVYDALTTHRIYKEAYSYDRAANMILNGECGQFSPQLLECFKRVRGDFARLSQTYADGHSPKSDSITTPLLRPSTKDLSTSSLQAAHAKLRTLMHYLGSTVAEVDLDSNVFHLLYNPNPEFSQMHTASSFESALSALAEESLHPDDRRLITDDLTSYLGRFFDSGRRRLTRRYRIRNALTNEYSTFEATALRIDMEDPDRRDMLAIWTPTEQLNCAISLREDAQQALMGIAGVVCCIKDRWLTIELCDTSLPSLLGYTRQEMEERCRNRFLELVLPEDREKLVRDMDTQLQSTASVEQEFRLQRRDGSTLWALAKGRIVTGADGVERLYGLINDISHIRTQQEELQKSLKRYQIIMGQTNDIVFEWDLRSDTMTCSAKWEARFGYAPIDTDFTARLARASHFHPDDLPAVAAQFRQVKDQKTSYLEAEARIANASGRYLWSQIRATVERDWEGNPLRLIGVIIDIDSDRRAAEALLSRAERDSLTKLFNKETARRRTEEYLTSCSKDSLAAMLIIDLDNFKTVNDTHGHLFGDVVLTRVAQEIQGLFRESDVLARIGGDEFLVFMKNIPAEALVEERCNRLLEIFRSMYPEQLADCGFSCSIGVSFFPEFGKDYQELFRRADWALYQAKRQGRNTYQFYRSDMAAATGIPAVTHTRIDSNEGPGLAENSLPQYVFNRLHESGDVEGTINSVLELLGTRTNVSRVYIFENSPDNKTCSNTFEWCNEGITPEMENLQDISYETDIPGYENNFDERGIFYCPDVRQLPPEQYEILEPQGVKSMLQCAIRENGQFRGYVGFDECTRNRLWTQEQIDLLTFLSHTIFIFLLKKRAQDATAALAEDLRSVLDKQQGWVYIIDPETFQLRFMNARTKALAPEAEPGMLCHRVFLDRELPCENCPAKQLHSKEDVASAIIRNYKLDMRVNSQASSVHWGGKNACLISCHQIPDTEPLSE